jgi:hypothetical protein
MKALKLISVLAVLAMTAPAALGDTITVNATLNLGSSQSNVINGTIVVNGSSETVGIGQLGWTNATWKKNGDVQPGDLTTYPDTFWTFCIEATPGATINWGQNYDFTKKALEDTPDVNLNPGTGTAADKAAAIKAVFGYLKDTKGWFLNPISSGISNANDARSVQLLVWEIIYDGVPSLPVAPSVFTGTSGNNFRYAADDANARLWLAQTGYDNPLAELSGLDGQQGQAIGLMPAGEGVVPLPATAGAVLALLAFSGFGRFRR